MRNQADDQVGIQVGPNTTGGDRGLIDRYWTSDGMRAEGISVYHHSTRQDELGEGGHVARARCRDCQDTVSRIHTCGCGTDDIEPKRRMMNSQ